MTGMAESKKLSVILVVVTGSMYIATSACLIGLNKHLMAPGQFPYTCALVLIQMIFCSTMALLLFLAMPQLFPSMSDPEKKVSVDFGPDGILLKGVLPIATLFSIQLILTNQSYLYADIAFLQMIKESNVIAVYLMSVAFAIEVFQWRHLRLIFLLVVATVVSVRGDSHFSSIGLSLQLSCFFFESLKITLQGMMLSGKGRGLDALSYVLLVCPFCAVIFGLIVSLFIVALPHQEFLLMPAFSDLVRMRWYLLGNCCLAFALNISVALFIKCSSAVSFVVAAIFKDVSIVLFDIVFMGKVCSPIQTLGFTCQAILVLTWSLVKTFPKEFENDLFEGFQIVFLGRRARDSQKGFDSIESPPETYGAVQDRSNVGLGKARV